MTNEEGVAAMTSGQGRRHGRGKGEPSSRDPGTPHTLDPHASLLAVLAHYTGRAREPSTRRGGHTPNPRSTACSLPRATRSLAFSASRHTTQPHPERHRTHSRQELQENAHYPHTVTKRCLTNLTWIGRAPKASYIKQSHNPKKHNPTFTH